MDTETQIHTITLVVALLWILSEVLLSVYFRLVLGITFFWVSATFVFYSDDIVKKEYDVIYAKNLSTHLSAVRQSSLDNNRDQSIQLLRGLLHEIKENEKVYHNAEEFGVIVKKLVKVN